MEFHQGLVFLGGDYILDKLNVIMAVANGVGNAIAALGRLESPVDAYNAAYHQTRQNYADNKTQQRQKDGRPCTAHLQRRYVVG